MLNYLQTTVSTIHSNTTDIILVVTLIRQYIDLSYFNLNKDSVDFWKNHKTVLDSLSEVAIKYACIPAIYALSKKIFSKAGQIISRHQNLLTLKNVDVLIFLNNKLEKIIAY